MATIKDVVPAGEQTYGYLAELSTIQLEDVGEEGGAQSWIQAAPVGRSYKHPLYGKVEFSEQKVKNFAANVNNRVRGIDIAIDYAHRTSDKAAGWVRQAEARANGLWLLVEWTKTAAEAIRNKEFRYFSPEFVDTYTDLGGSGQTFKDVLLGGGLTNRPFLKNLVPVNLSEVFDEEPDEKQKEEHNNNQEEEMEKEFLEKLRKQFSLSEDATEEQILEAARKATETPPEPPAGGDDDVQKQLSEAMATIATLQTNQRLSEVNFQLREWERGGEEQKFALPPALSDKVKAILLAEKSGENTFEEFMSELLKTGLVVLGEKGKARTAPTGGGGGGGSDDDKSATDRWNEAVQKYMEDHKDADLGDAVEAVARDNEQLYTEYREETYSFEERD